MAVEKKVVRKEREDMSANSEFKQVLKAIFPEGQKKPLSETTVFEVAKSMVVVAENTYKGKHRGKDKFDSIMEFAFLEFPRIFDAVSDGLSSAEALAIMPTAIELMVNLTHDFGLIEKAKGCIGGCLSC